MSKPTRPQPPASARKTAGRPATRQARTGPAAPPAYRPQAAPGVAQPKAATRQAKSAPAAPPVYRPQPAPKVLQRKQATAAPQQQHAVPAKGAPQAPPAYRPQPAPKVLQPKSAQGPKPPAPSKPPGGAVAPPAYRPQPTPKVLQRKTAAGRNETPAPGAGTPPPQAPRPAARPAAAASKATTAAPRVVQRQALPGVSGTIQAKLTPDEIIEWVNDFRFQLEGETDPFVVAGRIRNHLRQIPGRTGWGGTSEEFQELVAYSRYSIEGRQGFKKKDKAADGIEQDFAKYRKKQELLKSAPSSSAPQYAHLDTFHPKTELLTIHHKPYLVYALTSVDGKKLPDVPGLDGEAVDQITTPDNSDPKVTSTKEDGEVDVLIGALKSMTAFMNVKANQASAKRFTVALSGPWGACDGCKKRILKLIELWKARARPKFKRGVQATLVVTYRYLNEPQEVRDGNVYGWMADGNQNSPYYHTEGGQVVGENDA